MSRAYITESLLTDIADAIRYKLSSQDEYTPAEMADAIYDITGGGGSMVIVDEPDSHGGTVRSITGTVVTGTTEITTNGTHDVASYARAHVAVPSQQPTLQSKTATPTTSQQVIEPDTGYDGLSDVTISAMPSGTAGTPSASKGTVSNHSVSVTPSVTNSTGYITGGTISGTPVSVSASELVSGTFNATSNDDYDVTNYASVHVAVAAPTPSLQSKTATPTESQQTVSPDSGYDGLSSVTVEAIDSDYVGSGITRRSSSNLTVSGATVTAPAGYYEQSASKSVASGSATTPATSITANPSISVDSNGLITATVSGSKSVTPTVSAGYVSSGTAGTVSVSGSNTSQLSTQAAATITPSTSQQTAVAAGKYTTGNVVVSAMPSGTAGTPSATKGTVSNHSVSVTPSVTNTTGYITGGTKTGTAVTVSASELVSGTYNVTSSGTKDVTNYASASIPEGGAVASATKGTVSNHQVNITPSVTRTAGYVTAGTSSGTAVTVTASELVSGNLAITDNGTGIDVVNYATVSVDVPSSGADVPMFHVTMDSTFTSAVSVSCDWTFAEVIDYLDAMNEAALATFSIQGTSDEFVSPLDSYVASGTYAIFVVSGGGAPVGDVTIYDDETCTFAMPSSKVTTLTATANGTYTDSQGRLYSQVTVNVPTVTPTGTLSITSNGTYDVTNYASANVNVSGGGTGGDMSDPIRFFDYDGTLVASYTSVPSSLPSVPSHTGLTGGTWNYTLAQITTQFNAMGTCDVGANYTTVSGATEIDIVLQPGRLHPYLSLAVNGTVTIDWGDGSTSTSTGTSLTSRKSDIHHAYAAAGSYTIKITKTSGTGYSLYCTSTYTLLNANASAGSSNSVYANCVQAVRVGADCTIGNYAFYYCYSLESVSIPSGLTSIGTYAFYYCNSLESVSFPSGITAIGNYEFRYCYSFSSVSIPSSVTNIGNYVFANCYPIASVSVPNGLTTIGTYVFSDCRGLTSLRIPSGVTSIGNSAFASCYGMAEYHFAPTTPPTLGGTSVFNSIPSDAKIYVPRGSLDTYKGASNWSTYASYMVGE